MGARVWLLFACSCAVAAQPFLRVEIRAEHDVLPGKPVEIDLTTAQLPGGSDGVNLEVRRRGSTVPLRFQFTSSRPGAGTLIVLLDFPLKAKRPETLEIRLGRRVPGVPRLVTLNDAIDHQGQRSLRIETESGTYFYHKEGAGLASLIDRDGQDWISYRPGGGSAGEYRGIPNLGVYAHPGYTGEKGGWTIVESAGPIRARIRSGSRSGDYEIAWDFFPLYARMTIEKARQPYWFLYEGTPGGALDVDGDFVVTSTGLKRPVSESWTGDLPAPEWVFFGDAHQRRSLFLVNHGDDDANDQFWQMEGNMTVFGFGRQYRCCERYLTAAPAQFTIGLVEAKEFADVRPIIESAWRPVSVRVLGR